MSKPTVAELGDRLPVVIADHIEYLFRTAFNPEGDLLSDVCFRYITGEPSPFGNLAFFRRKATGLDVARDIGPLLEGPFPSAALFLNEGTSEQLEALTDAGFIPAEMMPLMSVTPEDLKPTELPEGYTFREVFIEDADEWNIAVSDGYGLPRKVGALFGIQRTSERCPPRSARHYAVIKDGQMVATSILFLHEDVAGIYAVATMPDHRGKGLGAHVTAEPLRLAWEEGYRTGLLQASEMGAPVYKRIGFQTHGEMALYVHIPE